MSVPPPTPRTFDEEDGDLSLLAGRRVAILGYGNQGHAHALNLRDSGVDVVVGLRPGSARIAEARGQGLSVTDVSAAVQGADIVMLLLPDEAQAQVYAEHVEPNLKADACVAFAHGFMLAFRLIELPPERRAVLVAPKGQGHKLREAYRAGGGLPSLLAVEGPDAEGTLQLALAYARGCGALAGGGTLTTFREEAVTDQFGEQAVLCGGLIELITAAWETLVDRGYSPEVAYFECLHEVKLIVDLVHAQGVDGMRRRISTTAAYGGMKAGPLVVGPESRRAMGELLDRIEDGRFARDFLDEQSGGSAWLSQAKSEEAKHPMQGTGKRLRAFLERCQLHAPDSREED